MKNKLTVITAIAMSILLAASVFTACSFNKESSEESTTLSPDDSWHPGTDEPYQPVELESVELAAIVSEALGEEAKDFNGDINSLSKEQIEKVKAVAEKEGYIVGTDENGDTVIQKDSNIKVSEASSEKTSEILSKAGVENTTRLSREQFEKVSKAADDKGATAVTDSKGNVKIIETTKESTTAAPKTTKGSGTTKENSTSKGDSNTTAATEAATPAPVTTTKSNVKPTTYSGGGELAPTNRTTPITTSYKLTGMDSSAVNTYSAGGNSIFVSSAAVNDGTIAVGNAFTNSSETASSDALIAKFNSSGKKVWSDMTKSDDMTDYEDVAVLADGSIIAVGSTLSENLVSDAEYRCKGTVEGVIAKYSEDGKRQWIKLFGGSGGDMAYAVAPTSDGGFVIGGKTDSTDYDLKGVSGERIKAFVAKYDASGKREWVSALTSTMHSAVKDITAAKDGIYVLIETLAKDGSFASLKAAERNKKYSVIAKYDYSGNKQWLKDFFESGQVNLVSITAANGGGCVAAGSYSFSKDGPVGTFADLHNGGPTGTFDGIIVCLEPSSTIKWRQPLIGFQSDYITGIATLKEGYAFTGYTTSTNRDFPFTNKGEYDSFAGVVSNGGTVTLIRSFGGSASDRAMSVCTNGVDTLYTCGSTYSADGDFASCDAKSNGSATVAFVNKYSIARENV